MNEKPRPAPTGVTQQDAGETNLIIGTLNCQSKLKPPRRTQQAPTGESIYARLTNPDTLGGWLDKHHIAALTDTGITSAQLPSLSSPGVPLFTNKRTFHGCARVGRSKGVALCVDSSFQIIANSETWQLDPCLQGRFVSACVSFSGNTGTTVNRWFLAVYAPATATPSERDHFYDCLSLLITSRIGQESYIILGDMNGCFVPSTDRCSSSGNPVSTPGDKAFQRFVHSRRLPDVSVFCEDYDICLHHTFANSQGVKSRIDHILPYSTHGLICVHIDSCLLNPLGVTHQYGKYSDHFPVTAIFQVSLWHITSLPPRSEMGRTFRSRYPSFTSRSSDISRFDSHVQTCLSHLPNSLRNLHVAASTPAEEQLTQLSAAVQTLLGHEIPHPCRTYRKRGKAPNYSSAAMSLLQRRLCHLRSTHSSVMILLRHHSGLSSFPRLQLARHFRNLAPHPDKEGVDPSFALRPFAILDPAYQSYKRSLDSALATLRQDVYTEGQRLQSMAHAHFTTSLARESRLMSHRLRTLSSAAPPPPPPLSSLKDPATGIVHNCPVEVARLLKEYYGEAFSEQPAEEWGRDANSWTQNNPAYVDIRKRIGDHQEILFAEVTQDTVKSFVQGRRNTATGLDKIEYNLLKLIFVRPDNTNPPATPALDETAAIVTFLLNSFLQAGFFPPALMLGEIVPIFKSGVSTDMSNYRPITLLSCLYKVATGIIHSRMRRLVEEAGAVSDMQASGRPDQSCHTKIITLLNVISHSKRSQTPLFLISTDIRKAFDTVPYEGVLFALKSIGFNERSIALIRAIQQGTECSVRVSESSAVPFPLKRGVKQGCPLSPLLFVLFMDIYLKHLHQSGDGYPFLFQSGSVPPSAGSTLTVPGGAFADDLVLLSNSHAGLSRMLEGLDSFLGSFGMHLNWAKCEYRALMPTQTTTPPPPLVVHDIDRQQHEIHAKPSTSPFKYLGYTIQLSHSVDDPFNLSLSHNFDLLWRAHSDTLFSRFNTKAQELVDNCTSGVTYVKLLNADLMSLLPFHSALCPLQDSLLRKATSEVARITKQKLGLGPNFPHAAIFAPATSNIRSGIGVLSPFVACETALVHATLNALRSSDPFARLTTLDTISFASSLCGVDVLNPLSSAFPTVGRSVESLSAWFLFPSYVKGLYQALGKTSSGESPLRIHRNPFLPNGRHFDTLFTLRPFLSDEGDSDKTLSRVYLLQIHHTLMQNGALCLSNLLPGLFLPPPGSTGPSYLDLLFSGQMPLATQESLSSFVTDQFADGPGSHLAYNIRPRLLRATTRWLVSYLLSPDQSLSIMQPEGCTLLPPPVPDPNIGMIYSASDGSYERVTNLGASAAVFNASVAVNTLSVASRFPGEQSASRAEVFALLLTLFSVSESAPLHIFIDCQSVLTSVNSCLECGIPHFLLFHKHVSHRSIICAICHKINLRSHKGSPTVLEKVRAHTTSAAYSATLNAQADTAAKAQRISMQPNHFLYECFSFLPSFYLVRSEDCIIESGDCSNIRHALNSALLASAIKTAGPTQHLHRCFSPPSVATTLWHEVRALAPSFSISLNFLRLKTGSLSTPRNLYQVHRTTHPRVFTSTSCPLCPELNADEHHVMCICPAIRLARKAAVTAVATKLAKSSPKDAPTLFHVHESDIRQWLLPLTPANFLWGALSVEIRDWALRTRHMSDDRALSFGDALFRAAHHLYAAVWKAYSAAVATAGWNTQARCQTIYNKSTWPKKDPVEEQLRKLHPHHFGYVSQIMGAIRSLAPADSEIFSSALQPDLANLQQLLILSFPQISPHPSPSHTAPENDATQLSLSQMEEYETTTDLTPCLVCKSPDPGTTSHPTFLWCDNISLPMHGGHYFCFGLDGVPSGNWFCPTCLSASVSPSFSGDEDDGSGPSHSPAPSQHSSDMGPQNKSSHLGTNSIPPSSSFSAHNSAPAQNSSHLTRKRTRHATNSETSPSLPFIQENINLSEKVKDKCQSQGKSTRLTRSGHTADATESDIRVNAKQARELWSLRDTRTSGVRDSAAQTHLPPLSALIPFTRKAPPSPASPMPFLSPKQARALAHLRDATHPGVRDSAPQIYIPTLQKSDTFNRKRTFLSDFPSPTDSPPPPLRKRKASSSPASPMPLLSPKQARALAQLRDATHPGVRDSAPQIYIPALQESETLNRKRIFLSDFLSSPASPSPPLRKRQHLLSASLLPSLPPFSSRKRSFSALSLPNSPSPFSRPKRVCVQLSPPPPHFLPPVFPRGPRHSTKSSLCSTRSRNSLSNQVLRRSCRLSLLYPLVPIIPLHPSAPSLHPPLRPPPEPD